MHRVNILTTYILPVVVLAGSALWSWVFFDHTWDLCGNSAIMLCIMIDTAFLIIGSILTILSFMRRYPMLLALTILIMPFLHLAGAPVNAPWCFPLFFAPMLVVGVFTLILWTRPDSEAQPGASAKVHLQWT